MGIAWMHDAPLAALALVAVCVLIGAALAVTLVAMTDKKNRPWAIRASATVLTALLPWRPRGPGRPRFHPPGRQGRRSGPRRLGDRPCGPCPHAAAGSLWGTLTGPCPGPDRAAAPRVHPGAFKR
jgi:hypothetical protein